MTDTDDLIGDLTGLDVQSVETWFKRVGRVASGMNLQLSRLSVEAPDMVGKDRRLHEAELLRNHHEVVLAEARSTVGRIAAALRDLETRGRTALRTHTATDVDAAAGIDGGPGR